MEFFSFIPAWIACGLLYGSSAHQKVFTNPINKPVALLLSIPLLIAAIMLIHDRFPLTSSVLAGLMLVMTFLPFFTIVSGYGRHRLFQLSSVLFSSSLILVWLNGGF